MYRGQTEFRPPTWQLVFLVAAATGLPLASFFLWRSNGFDWVTIGFVAFSIVALAAVVETLTTRVVLTDAHVEIRKLFRTTKIERGDIGKATWSKGVGASIQCGDGTWVHLPDVGAGADALSNAIRAWAKAE